MGHGLTNVGDPYVSDFGTGATNQNQTTLYMAQRTAIFFRTILIGSTINGTKLFVECENYRNSCDPTENNAGCAGRTVEDYCR